MDLLTVIILSVVEGVTEFLPISSTGHLILTSRILQLPHTPFVSTFQIAIQSGAILSVIVLYWKRLLVDRRVTQRVALAFLPTAVIGFIFYERVKQFLSGGDQIVLWALFIGGILLIVFELLHKESPDATADLENISFKQCFLIGLFQSAALIPGVSRAAATIIGGLFLGLKRRLIVEFSFLLAIPTMLAATGFDLAMSAPDFTPQEFGYLAAGFLISFAVALFAVKFLLRYIQNHDFKIFGVYRIVLALLFWMIVR